MVTKCHACHGTKQIMGMGMRHVECWYCKGTGIKKELESVKPVSELPKEDHAIEGKLDGKKRKDH